MTNRTGPGGGRMEHEQNSFVVNVFTNGVDPAREQREKEKVNME